MSATLEEFAAVDAEEPEAVVVAECANCSSVHPVASRQADDDTAASTVCPECGAVPYSTTVRDRGAVVGGGRE